MKEFRFRAVNGDDVPENGTLLAYDSMDASRRLVARGLYPLDVSPSRSLRGILNSDIRLQRLSRADIAQLLTDIGHLISSGIEVAPALTLVSTSGASRTRRVVSQLLERVRKGNSLSESMRAERRTFSDYIIAVTRASEASNSLGPGLLRIADNLSKSAALRSQVQTALIYPACIAVAVVTAIAVLVIVVVPTLEGVFGDHARLPWQTRFLVYLSDGVRTHYIAVVASVAAVVTTQAVLLRIPETKRQIEGVALNVPGLGEFLRTIETAQIATMLAMLTTSNIPLVEAVSMVRDGARFSISRIALEEAIAGLREGRRLHEALANVPTLSPRVLAIIQIGDSTGRLGPLLDEAARDAARRVSLSTDRVLALLPPVMTLIFGFVAGFVLYAVMTAILSVNTLTTRGL